MAEGMSMNWHKNMYTGASLQQREAQLRRQLDNGDTDVKAYVITEAVNPEDQLDIRQAGDFIRRYGDDPKGPAVVGIAANRKEAVTLLREIVENCVAHTGKADLRRYFEFDSE